MSLRNLFQQLGGGIGGGGDRSCGDSLSLDGAIIEDDSSSFRRPASPGTTVGAGQRQQRQRQKQKRGSFHRSNSSGPSSPAARHRVVKKIVVPPAAARGFRRSHSGGALGAPPPRPCLPRSPTASPSADRIKKQNVASLPLGIGAPSISRREEDDDLIESIERSLLDGPAGGAPSKCRRRRSAGGSLDSIGLSASVAAIAQLFGGAAAAAGDGNNRQKHNPRQQQHQQQRRLSTKQHRSCGELSIPEDELYEEEDEEEGERRKRQQEPGDKEKEEKKKKKGGPDEAEGHRQGASSSSSSAATPSSSSPTTLLLRVEETRIKSIYDKINALRLTHDSELRRRDMDVDVLRHENATLLKRLDTLSSDLDDRRTVSEYAKLITESMPPPHVADSNYALNLQSQLGRACRRLEKLQGRLELATAARAQSKEGGEEEGGRLGGKGEEGASSESSLAIRNLQNMLTSHYDESFRTDLQHLNDILGMQREMDRRRSEDDFRLAEKEREIHEMRRAVERERESHRRSREALSLMSPSPSSSSSSASTTPPPAPRSASPESGTTPTLVVKAATPTSPVPLALSTRSIDKDCAPHQPFVQNHAA